MTEPTPRDDETRAVPAAGPPPADPPSWPAPEQPAQEQPGPQTPAADGEGYPYGGASSGAYAPPEQFTQQYGQPVQQYGQPAQQYGQPAPYTGGQPYVGGQGYAGNQGYAGSGQPSSPPATSTIVLLVLSGLATLSFWFTLAGIAPLVMSIVALTKNKQDPAGARRLTRIGWWVLAGLMLLGIILSIAFFAVVAANDSSSNFSSTY